MADKKKNEPLQEKVAYHKSVMDDCRARWEALLPYLPPNASMNTMEARINGFIAYMVELGVITDEQAMDFEIAQAEMLHRSIKEVEADLEKAKRQAKNPLLVPKGSGEKKLIIPGQE